MAFQFCSKEKSTNALKSRAENFETSDIISSCTAVLPLLLLNSSTPKTSFHHNFVVKDEPRTDMFNEGLDR
ncbi:hypothetical protein ACFX2I_036812 [Malus domestica]